MDQFTSETARLVSIEKRHGSGVVPPRQRALAGGAGAIVTDVEGRTFIDLIGGHGVTLVGHCHPSVVAAIRDQAGSLITCSASFPNEPRVELYRELASVTPDGIDRFFLCNSGAEAVEAALKFARLGTGRTEVVALSRGFHGRTMGALSATWEPRYREPFVPLLSGFQHVVPNDSQAIDDAVTDRVACVILEAVQGESGVHPLEHGYLQHVEALCRARGIMLIVDEIQAGLGRTGAMWAHDHAGITPDIICIGKGIAGGVPMGAVALGSRIPELPRGAHGSTFGGNPLACAAAVATLRVLKAEGLVERSQRLGAVALERLLDLTGAPIHEVRGCGLMMGIELTEPAKPYLDALENEGVLALSAGPDVIRLLPPLTIDEDHLHAALGTLERVLTTP